jgi:tRNA/rRNA methyltransferase
VRRLAARPQDRVALVFGNETRGLSRSDLDRSDFVVRIPTVDAFPVLNLTQSIAILLSYFHLELRPSDDDLPVPAAHTEVEALMDHLKDSLSDIGFLDQDNPDRILRKLRRLLGRAGATENEVAILRGMCRQIQWAARTGPLAGGSPGGDRETSPPREPVRSR